MLGGTLGGLFGTDGILSVLVNAQNDPDPAVLGAGAEPPSWASIPGAPSSAPFDSGRYDVAALVIGVVGAINAVEVVLAGLLAGVPVVPVPPDAGPAEREHVLRDSRAVAWLGPTGLGGGLPPVVPDGSGSTWHAPAVDPDRAAAAATRMSTSRPANGWMVR